MKVKSGARADSPEISDVNATRPLAQTRRGEASKGITKWKGTALDETTPNEHETQTGTPHQAMIGAIPFSMSAVTSSIVLDESICRAHE